MKLSEHLDLSEVTRSDMAKRKGVSNMPTPEHIENFKILAENIFEPIRKHFGVPIMISSGYRSKELNKAIGGASTSQHLLGQALDLDMDGTPNGVTNKMVFDFIKNILEVEYANIRVTNEIPIIKDKSLKIKKRIAVVSDEYYKQISGE